MSAKDLRPRLARPAQRIGRGPKGGRGGTSEQPRRLHHATDGRDGRGPGCRRRRTGKGPPARARPRDAAGELASAALAAVLAVPLLGFTGPRHGRFASTSTTHRPGTVRTAEHIRALSHVARERVTLTPGESLGPGQRLAAGFIFLIMQEDGNLVLYRGARTARGVIWASNTSHFFFRGAHLVLKDSGVAVIQKENTTLWKTPPPPPANGVG